MSVFDWLSVGSSVARLVGLLASAALGVYSAKLWLKGDIQRATLVIGWAIFLRFGQ
jgi:hypothetical protein